jgi:hypothetical protein
MSKGDVKSEIIIIMYFRGTGQKRWPKVMRMINLWQPAAFEVGTERFKPAWLIDNIVWWHTLFRDYNQNVDITLKAKSNVFDESNIGAWIFREQLLMRYPFMTLYIQLGRMIFYMIFKSSKLFLRSLSKKIQLMIKICVRFT